MRELLRRTPDLERALSRLALDRGGPRDLAAIRDGLAQAGRLGAALAGELPEVLAAARAATEGHEALAARLEAALVAEPPVLVRDGGLVAAGHDAELDATRRLRDEGRGVIAELQAEYVRRAGIGALKIRHNNVLGYFIETPATHAERMLKPPLAELFVHRQTTANALRFTTLALAEIETKILNAGGLALEIERRIFERLRGRRARPRRADRAPRRRRWRRSTWRRRSPSWRAPRAGCGRRSREDRAFRVVAGRHPVVEAALRRSGASFVANDAELGADGRRRGRSGC